MLVRLLALVLVLASGACRCGKEAEPVAARATEPPDSTAEGGLAFIRDDYDRALAWPRSISGWVAWTKPWRPAIARSRRSTAPGKRAC